METDTIIHDRQRLEMVPVHIYLLKMAPVPISQVFETFDLAKLKKSAN